MDLQKEGWNDCCESPVARKRNVRASLSSAEIELATRINIEFCKFVFFFYSFILFIQPLFSDEKVKFTKANYNYDIKTMFTYLTEKLKTKNVKSFSNRIESKVEPIKSEGCNHMINVLIC